jgi:hypothetical protein
MIQLPNITLIALTNKDFEGHKKAIDKSCEGIEFGGVKLIWDEKCNSIDEWNRKIVYELDGFVINPELWNPDWPGYDYIGAPWPMPVDDYSYRTPTGEIVRVGNSVSLRSKRLMELPSKIKLEWRPFYGNTNEDGLICCHHRHEFVARGMKFAPLDVAKHFSKEHTIPENKDLDTFMFHSL